MTARVKKWVFGILGIAAFFYAIMLFGDAFRAYMLPFALLWVLVPIFACFLCRQSLLESFTLAGLRRVQSILMVIVVALSFAMFADLDQVRNAVGKHFVSGYQHWRSEPDTDDYGRPYYPGDGWTARNRSGRWGIQAFELAIWIGIFALPAITLKAARRAVYKKEAQCSYTTDGNRVETYHTRI
jgi:hypothetical protein